ncbi:minor tail protein [Gordonia phage Eyre]|uniref:Minor tail protein n=1 Tax=Gordonia phage Eyre TaxID=1887646 RepID=A0A1B3AZY3_9CAUD|nr:minor tail protein [Gordonia phage Eyre]AOE44304.1 minor tail protein [Gordonia phage Eyre]
MRVPGRKPLVPAEVLEEIWERIRDAVIIAPFAWLIAFIAGGDESDWDTLDEIQANLLPALVRRVLGPLGRFIDTGADDEIDGDLGDKLNPIRTAATGVNDLADNIRNAVTGGVAAGIGNIAEAFDAVASLFGIADNAEKIAMAAQQQLQDITNETNTPGWSGYAWSQVFSGADGTPLPSTDWATTRIAIVGDDGHAGIINNSTDGEHFCTVRDIHKFATDSQSASIVVGKKWSFSDDRWTSIRLRCDDDVNPTEGAVCWVRPGNVRIGRFSGGSNTYWNTISQPIKSGDIVRFRCHGDNYYVLVNGVTVFSWTDVGASVSKGAGFRHAGFTQEYLNGLFADQASFQIASWAMADWVPAGGAVTTPSWRFRRSTAGFANLAVAGGGVAALPSGFFSVSDLAAAVTVTNLGLGQVTIAESGFYRLHLTAQATVDTDRGTPYVPCVWGVYVDSNLVSGAIVGETEVYLAAGQVVSPRIFAGWPATQSTTSQQSTALTLSNVKDLLAQTSTIDSIGGPSAAWTGRKVA